MHYLHAFIGTYLLCVTVVVSFYQLHLLRFEIRKVTLHTVAALTVVGLVVVCWGLAFGTYVRGYHNGWKMHKLVGRLLLVIGFVASLSGLYNY